jgi:hypothetical protein
VYRRRLRGSSESGWRRRRRGLEEEVAAARLLFRRRWLLGIWEGGVVGEGRSGSPSTSIRPASCEDRVAAGGQGERAAVEGVAGAGERRGRRRRADR